MDDLEAARQQLDQQRRRIDELKNANRALRDSSRAKSREVARLRAEGAAQLAAQAAAAKAEADTVKAEADQRLARAERLRVKAETKSSRADRVTEFNEAMRIEVDADLLSVENERAAVTAVLHEKEETIKGLEQKVHVLESDLEQVKLTLARERASLIVTAAVHGDGQALELERARRELAAEKEERIALAARLEDIDGWIRRLEIAVRERDEHIARVDAERNNQAEENSRLQATIEGLERRLETTMTPDRYRLALFDIGRQAYGAGSYNTLRREDLDHLDVGEFRQNMETLLQSSAVWDDKKSMMTAVEGKEPEAAKLQLALEIDLFSVNGAWRLTPALIATVCYFKGVTEPIQAFLNQCNLSQSRRSQLRRQHFQEATMLQRLIVSLNKSPTSPPLSAHDNFQRDCRGSSASLGSEHRDRAVRMIDGIQWRVGNPPDPEVDPWRLDRGEVAFSLVLNVPLLKRLLETPTGPWFQALELRAGRGLGSTGYDLKSTAATEDEERKKNKTMTMMLDRKEEYYRCNPDIRRHRGKLGLSGSEYDALGCLPYPSAELMGNVRWMLYYHKTLQAARVDADCLGPNENWRVGRFRWVGGDSEAFPQYKKVLAVARSLGLTVFNHFGPYPELWHAVKCFFHKLIYGTNYDKPGRYGFARHLFFELYYQTYRKTTKVDWGKLHKQAKFDDHLRVCHVVHNAWLSVRPELLPKLLEHLAKTDTERNRGARAVHDFFENDLPVAVYFVPSLVMDPDSFHEAILHLARVADRWHVCENAKHLAQFAHDIERLTPERRRVVQENICDFVAVKIEYLHAILAETQHKRSRAGCETTNRQHANIEDLRKGLELFHHFVPTTSRPERQTYHVKSTLGTGPITEAVAGHICLVVDRSIASTSRYATKQAKKKQVVDKEWYIITGLLENEEMKLPAAFFLDLPDAQRARITKLVDALKKSNTLASLIPDEQLVPHELRTEGKLRKEDEKKLTQLKKQELHAALRRRGNSFGGDWGLARLRQHLAPTLRDEYVRDVTAEDGHKLMQDVATQREWLNDAQIGNLPMVGNVGVFKDFSSRDCEAEPEDTAAEATETDEAAGTDEAMQLDSG